MSRSTDICRLVRHDMSARIVLLILTPTDESDVEDEAPEAATSDVGGSAMPLDPDPADIVEEDEPMPFAGDYFGDDYVEADFDWIGGERDDTAVWNEDGIVSLFLCENKLTQ